MTSTKNQNSDKNEFMGMKGKERQKDDNSGKRKSEKFKVLVVEQIM